MKNDIIRRSVALLIAVILPAMALHYTLGFAAIPAPALPDWPLLILDSLVVGYLALMMAGGNAMAARHAAAQKGVPLPVSYLGEPAPQG